MQKAKKTYVFFMWIKLDLNKVISDTLSLLTKRITSVPSKSLKSTQDPLRKQGISWNTLLSAAIFLAAGEATNLLNEGESREGEGEGVGVGEEGGGGGEGVGGVAGEGAGGVGAALEVGSEVAGFPGW